MMIMIPIDPELKGAIVRHIVFNTYDVIREMTSDYVKRRMVGFGIKGSFKGAWNETNSYITSRITGCEHKPSVPGIKFIK